MEKELLKLTSTDEYKKALAKELYEKLILGKEVINEETKTKNK